jgi:hypothetical protein
MLLQASAICDFCDDPRVVDVFKGRSITVTAARGHAVDMFPIGSADGDWSACAECASLVKSGERDLHVMRVADKLSVRTGAPPGFVQPRVIGSFSRFWAAQRADGMRSYVISDVCTPRQRTLIEFFRRSKPSEHPGRGLERAIGNGVYASVYLKNVTELGRIAVYFYDIRSTNRERGHASAALTRLCELADANGVDLVLPVKAYELPPYPAALSDAELVAWYGRHGFVETGKRSEVGSPYMLRVHAAISEPT